MREKAWEMCAFPSAPSLPSHSTQVSPRGEAWFSVMQNNPSGDSSLSNCDAGEGKSSQTASLLGLCEDRVAA